ncbi:MAG TPA: Gfo/Idh/MocA family oxidoreductase [Chloroflexota bacterium]|jgi:predicted dehydrogenase|nr:Gfo/Idh/MocA family oxidoreductase [Chloroflexota bacterium]
MTAYRAAIVGLTGIGAAPLAPAAHPAFGEVVPHSHAGAYALEPRATVVGVCDLKPELLERFRADWGARFPDARGYTDHRELLAEQRPDLISVVTSDNRHAQIVLDAVAAGVKGVFCEKPIATTLADADRMIAACRAAGVPLVINHSRRWYPEFHEARRLIRAGAVGPLRRIVATLGGPRAMLFRNGTHLLDAVCFFAESEPAWAIGELDDEHRAYGPRYAGDGGRDPSTDPGGSAYVHFENGRRAFVSASKGTVGNFELDLVGERGRVRLGAHVAELLRPDDDGRLTAAALDRPRSARADTVAAVAHLIDLVEGVGEELSTGEDGRRVLSILLAILQSSAAGSQPVRFPVRDA